MRLDGTDFGQFGLDQLWASGLAAVPLALGVWLLCRFCRIRPATRHMLWVIVLVSLVTPMIGGLLGLPRVSLEAWLPTVQVAGGRVDQRSATGTNAIEVAPDSRLVESQLTFGRRYEMNDASVDRLLAMLDANPRADDRAAVEFEPNSSAVTSEKQEPSQSALRNANGVGPGTTTVAVLRRGAESTQRVATADRMAETNPAIEEERASTAYAPIREELARWGAAFMSMRSAVGTIPPIPAAVWLSGIVAVLAWRLVRVAFFLRTLGAGSPAPQRVQSQVRNIAMEIGLARVPTTVMLDRRMSPMVWCGLRPVLVLPVGLWGELDREGQRAVLMHELAHLRRRDHLVVWLTQLVSLVYWWHPVVWWARRRIDEEADFACDAWVTSLRPSGRRVYAETLVVAKSYVSGPGLCRVVGLPMASRNARQLSRRLTMVMTQRTSPGLSALGLVLAAGVAAAGMFVTPTLAGPDDGKKAAQSAQPETPAAPVAVEVAPELPTSPLALQSLVVPFSPGALGVPVSAGSPASPLASGAAPAVWAPAVPIGLVGTVPGSPTSFDRHMAGLDGPEDPDLRELLKRIERLEKALKELRGQAESRGSGLRYRSREVEVGAAARADVERMRVRSERLRADAVVKTRQNRAIQNRVVDGSAQVRSRAAASPREAVWASGAAPADRSPNPPTAQTDGGGERGVAYTLSSGKLEALTELMALQDVPILISRGDGNITVYGTAAQQRVFAAFVKMIDPDSKSDGPRDRRPQRAAPSRDRSDRGADRDTVIAAVQARDAERMQKAVIATVKADAAERVRDVRARYARVLQAANTLQTERADLRTHVKSLAASNEALQKRQRTLHGQAANMRQSADNLRARLLDGAYESKKEFEAKIVELQNLAQRKEVEAKAVFAKAKSVRGEFADLRERLKDLEAKAAEMTRKAEALKRHIRELSASRDE